ncbi:hypothetical protein H0W26_04975 [Candidatus Dependentiae bacterium]|nr:hypothetical protein [Candidatus Dependentiae bacterium]
MIDLHKGIVLRAPSPFKTAIVLLDEHYGKIEGMTFKTQKGQSLCHGALISYIPRKRQIKYTLEEQTLLDMPLEWARQDFVFFHYILELCGYFLQWDEPSPEVFRLVHLLSVEPSSFQDKETQKKFLCHLFTYFGMYPDLTGTTLAGWFRTCIVAQFHTEPLRIAAFLKVLDRYENCS